MNELCIFLDKEINRNFNSKQKIKRKQTTKIHIYQHKYTTKISHDAVDAEKDTNHNVLHRFSHSFDLILILYS